MSPARTGHPAVVLDSVGHAAFPHVVALPEGSLLAVWRRASGHMQPDGSVWAATSADDGASWSPPRLLVEAPHDARDPCLTVLPDGRLALSWFDFDGSRSTGVRVSFSDDGGRTFARTVLLPQVWGRWTAVSAPVVQAAGALLLPVYGCTGRRRTDVALLGSTDGGATWELMTHLLSGGAVRDALSEPWVVPDQDGRRLACLVRADSGRVRRLTSADAGRTWTGAQELFTSSSRVAWLPLGGQRALTVHRSVVDEATVLRTTTDDWSTWSGEQVLDEVGRGTYAGLVALGQDRLCTVYGAESADRRSGRVVACTLPLPDAVRPGPS